MGRSSGRAIALWSCPGCGRIAELDTHRVAADGEVSPSAVCSRCDFHDYITLDEVQPEVVTNR